MYPSFLTFVVAFVCQEQTSENEEKPKEEANEEIDIDLEDPEVQTAALKIQVRSQHFTSFSDVFRVQFTNLYSKFCHSPQTSMPENCSPLFIPWISKKAVHCRKGSPAQKMHPTVSDTPRICDFCMALTSVSFYSCVFYCSLESHYLLPQIRESSGSRKQNRPKRRQRSPK